MKTELLNEIFKQMDEVSRNHCTEAEKFAKEYVGGNENTDLLIQAVKIMDIGKVKISSAILSKGPELTDDEREEISKHGYYGYKILKDSRVEETIANAILLHNGEEKAKEIWKKNENVDFPEVDIATKKLSIIIGMIDSFVGMTQKRPYRPPFTKEAALRELKKNKTADEDLLEYIEEMIREERARFY